MNEPRRRRLKKKVIVLKKKNKNTQEKMKKKTRGMQNLSDNWIGVRFSRFTYLVILLRSTGEPEPEAGLMQASIPL